MGFDPKEDAKRSAFLPQEFILFEGNDNDIEVAEVQMHLYSGSIAACCVCILGGSPQRWME
jgi:hypothetical protein